ncbi:MAG: hypothetical protein IJS81_07620, partial [Selenomonadaceae bacterium]|nr:hypothetical protein [Selenomonadaceae bacterium]
LIIKVEPWRKLVLRDCLIENQIKFIPVFQEDTIWTLELLCTAKKIVMIPAACYIYRLLQNSYSKVGAGDNEQIRKNIRRKMDRTIRAMNTLDEFLGKIEFFKKRPDYRYAAINNFLMIDLNWLQNECFNLPPHIVKEICQTEFAKYLGEHSSVISQLFANSVALTRELILSRQKIIELSAPPSKDILIDAHIRRKVLILLKGGFFILLWTILKNGIIIAHKFFERFFCSKLSG